MTSKKSRDRTVNKETSMGWHPDVPDLPIKKPKQIETLEKLDPRVREAMMAVEIEERIKEIAHAVAEAYTKSTKNPKYEVCLEIVSVALRVTGSSLGGRLGTAMIASSEHAAKIATDAAFPPEPEF
jgi:hypothetical protein